jgi:hypothetical protein
LFVLIFNFCLDIDSFPAQSTTLHVPTEPLEEIRATETKEPHRTDTKAIALIMEMTTSIHVNLKEKVEFHSPVPLFLLPSLAYCHSKRRGLQLRDLVEVYAYGNIEPTVLDDAAGCSCVAEGIAPLL